MLYMILYCYEDNLSCSSSYVEYVSIIAMLQNSTTIQHVLMFIEI